MGQGKLEEPNGDDKDAVRVQRDENRGGVVDPFE